MSSAPAHIRWGGAAAPVSIVHDAPIQSPAAKTTPAKRKKARSPRRVQARRRQRLAVPKDELTRLLEIREVETKLARLRLEARDLDEQRRAMHVEADCPICAQQLGHDGFRHIRALVMKEQDSVRVDVAYFEQRLEQLAAPGASLQDDARDAGFVDDPPDIDDVSF